MKRGDVEAVGLKIYLVYSRKDAAFANLLRDRLASNGMDVYLDIFDIPPMEEWQQRLSELIAASDRVLFLISPDSIRSEMCEWELSHARSEGKTIVPLLYRHVGDAELPNSISNNHIIHATSENFFQNHFTDLIRLLKTDIGWVRQHTRFAEAARLWLTRSKHPDYLLRGIALKEAEAWAASRPMNVPELTEIQLEFLQQSKARSARRFFSMFRPGERLMVYPDPKPRGTSIFISYRRVDTRHVAGRIYDKLVSEFPDAEIFFDVDAIPTGVDFRSHISKSLLQASTVLAVMGDKWIGKNWAGWRNTFVPNDEDFVRTEIELALELGVPIVPLLVDNCIMPSDYKLPVSLRKLTSLNAASVRSGKDFHGDMAIVVNTLRQIRERSKRS